MHHIRSELNKLLGQVERLDDSSPANAGQLYDLLKRAYDIISDSFDLDQCHSILHHLRSQLRELDRLHIPGQPERKENTTKKKPYIQPGNENPDNNEKNHFLKLKKSSINELRTFISHL